MSYSVVIRTLGTAGSKYQKLLDSISQQTVQPSEVIVVLPHGYEKPKEQLGWERFLFSEKGMVHQRAYGIQNAGAEYLLVVDDDVAFESDFVQELYKIMDGNDVDCICPSRQVMDAKKTFRYHIEQNVLKLFLMFTGRKFYSKRKSLYNIRIANTAGHILNIRKDSGQQLLTQSGHGTCHFIKNNVAKDVAFNEEIWLDEVRYAWPEDQVYFYKMFLLGYRILFSKRIFVSNLNAKTTFQENLRSRMVDNALSEARNPIIFWHRFLFLPERSTSKKIWKILCIIYRICVETFVIIGRNFLFIKRWKVIKSHFCGYYNALGYLKSASYKNLARIANKRFQTGI